VPFHRKGDQLIFVTALLLGVPNLVPDAWERIGRIQMMAKEWFEDETNVEIFEEELTMV
jgi:hypothetical protein